jgi:pimeloyl-ACP methyl ester carboxylesterase
MGFVRANGLDIAYERAGAGSPLLFVHGAAEDGRIWRRARRQWPLSRVDARGVSGR